MVIIWIIIFVIALILEFATSALVSIWFCLAAVPSLIAAVCGANLTVQLIIFTAVTIICLIFTRPALKKLMPHKFIPTNTELIIGKTAIVIEEINNALGKGRVRLDGIDWSAISSDDMVISCDSVVIVEEIRSAKLVVLKK